MTDCLKIYACGGQTTEKMLAAIHDPHIPSVRLVDLCGQHLISSNLLTSLVSKVGDAGKEFQWEVPPLYGREHDSFSTCLQALQNQTKENGSKFKMVVNDLGVLQSAFEVGVPFIIGRALNKSFLRLPEGERLGAGPWMTLDAVLGFLPDGPPALPWSDAFSLSYLRNKGLAGCDVDGEPSLLKAALQELESSGLDIYLHSDDIFSATGRHCLYQTLFRQCRPNQCSEPTFEFQYEQNGGKTDNAQWYETTFHTRGKTVFRSGAKPAELSENTRVKIIQGLEKVGGESV